jgi:hypothetical protein
MRDFVVPRVGMSSNLLRIVIGIALAAGLLAVVLQGVDFAAMGRAMAHADKGLLVAVVLVTVAVYAVRAWRWGELLAPLARVPFARLFSATMVGFAANLIIPRSGEVMRPWLLSRRHGSVTASGAFATVIVERIVDLVSVLVLFALYLYVLPRPQAEVHNRLLHMVEVGGVVATVGAAVVIVLLWALYAHAAPTVAFIDRLLARAPRGLAQRVGRLLHQFADGLAVMHAPAGHWFRIGWQSLLHWLLVALSYHLVQRALGIDVPLHATFLLMALLVVGESIPTPGMVGGFHAFYVLCLVEAFGVDRSAALAAAIAAHALTNLPVLAIGLPLLGHEGLTFRGATQAARAEPAPH